MQIDNLQRCGSLCASRSVERGSPPAGAPECRGQAQVPDWAGDWRHAGPLSSMHGISTIYQDGLIEAQWDGPHFRHGLCCMTVREHEGADAAARFAIVDAAADKLEAGR